MLIDDNNFVGKFNLPQTSTTDGATLVNQFVASHENDYLQKVLGYELWKILSDEVSGSGSGPVSEQRLEDLLAGVLFEHNSKKYYWKGFEALDSPEVAYIYYKFLENEAQTTTLSGQVATSTDNSKRVNPVPKMIAAWNLMVEDHCILHKLLGSGAYPEWDHNCNLINRKNFLDL